MTVQIAVVGGGAVGVTVAGDLANRGVDVSLFERRSVASGSSGRAAGVVYDAYAEDVDADLAGRSLERFRDLAGPDSFDFTDCPYVLAVREGDDTADNVPEMVDRMREHGRSVSLVDPDSLGDRFPIRTDDLVTVAVADNAGYVDPADYTEAMAHRAMDAGVEVVEEAPVALATDDDGLATDPPEIVVDPDGYAERRRFDAVVVAAGAHTGRLFADADVPLAVKPYRVQALTGRADYAGPMTYDATAGVYFRPHPTGLLAGDGTEEVEADPDGYDRGGDDWFVDGVRDALAERAGYELDVERAWAGLCTATPDNDPLLGEVEPGVFVGTGWQGHGFMRAPGHAEVLAEGALMRAEGGTDADPTGEIRALELFDPTRFPGDIEFEICEGMAVENR